MTDQNTFMETISNVREIIRTAESPMTEEEILDYFADMELNDNQKQLVMDYLCSPLEEETKEEQEETPIEDSDVKVLNEKDNVVFKMYLEELSYLKEYTEEEEIHMYQELLQGNSEVIKALSDCYLKRVLEIAKKYVEPKLNIEDLIQEGNMALFLKLKELCGAGNVDDFSGVLNAAIEEGIVNYASEMNGERELENAVVAKISLVHEAKKILKQESGAEPTLLQLSEYTKISIDELEDIVKML